jgi:hypothetical protein
MDVLSQVKFPPFCLFLVYPCDSIAQGINLWTVQLSQNERRGLTSWVEGVLVHRKEPYPLMLSQKTGDAKCQKEARELQILLALALSLNTLNVSTTVNYTWAFLSPKLPSICPRNELILVSFMLVRHKYSFQNYFQ